MRRQHPKSNRGELGDYALLVERRQLRVCDARLGEHLVGMFAERWREAPEGSRRALETCRWARLAHRTPMWMLGFDDDLIGHDLRVVQHFLTAEHGRARHLVGAQALEPFSGAFRLQDPGG